jgi:hypothetical protein
MRNCFVEIGKLRTELSQLRGRELSGLPIGAVMAFDLPDGCPPGDAWQPFDAAVSRTIVGAARSGLPTGTIAPRGFREKGGSQIAKLRPENLPTVTMRFYYGTSNDLHSAGAEVVRNITPDGKLVGGTQHLVEITAGGKSDEFSIEMPYLPLFFCKKVR